MHTSGIWVPCPCPLCVRPDLGEPERPFMLECDGVDIAGLYVHRVVRLDVHAVSSARAAASADRAP